MLENVSKKFNRGLVKSNMVIAGIQGPALAQDWACREKLCRDSPGREKISRASRVPLVLLTSCWMPSVAGGGANKMAGRQMVNTRMETLYVVMGKVRVLWIEIPASSGAKLQEWTKLRTGCDTTKEDFLAPSNSPTDGPQYLQFCLSRGREETRH